MMSAGQFGAALAGALVATIILLGSPQADAGRVKCPVCGQVFDDSQERCPNDGTDLVLSGKKVADEEPGPEVAREPGDEGDEEAATGEGYRRQDKGGDRRRLDDEEGSGYSERRKRLSDDRGETEDTAEKKRRAREKRRKEFDEKDSELRSTFEARRAALWGDRGSAEDKKDEPGEGLKKLREHGLWTRGAPLTSLGLRLSWMGEGRDGGPVAGAEAEINPLRSWIRVGGSLFFGVRSLSSRDETLFLARATVGIQRPWRYSPYLVAAGGLGVLMASRFGEDLAYFVRSLGVEGGMDCHATRNIVITPSLGWVRYSVEDAHWDSFTVKVSVGF